MSLASVEVTLQIPTILGEGPVWSAQEGVLYWLDIFKPAINRFDPRSGMNAPPIACSWPANSLFDHVKFPVPGSRKSGRNALTLLANVPNMWAIDGAILRNLSVLPCS